MMTHFHFLRPLWLLGLIPLGISLIALWKRRDTISLWRKNIAPHLLEAMLIRGSGFRWFNPVTLSLVVSVIAIIALAGPSWERRPSPFAQDEAVLVIGLDLAETMNQKDIQPSRLERAKQKIYDLLELRKGSRTGLIVYAGSAHSVIPLTNDPDIINNLLAAIVTKMMPRSGKSPQKVLSIADEMFKSSPVPGTLLIIGDGIGAESEKAFAEYFANRQHQLLVLGVGKEKTQESKDMNTFMPLEKNALVKLAAAGGGYYQSLTIDKEDVTKLQKRVFNHLANVDDKNRPWVDAGYYLLYAVALLALFFFRKGWTLHWAVVILALCLFLNPNTAIADDNKFLDLWITPDQQGRYYMEKGDYKTAAKKFENLAWKAIAYYRAENFKAAAQVFSRIDTVDGIFNLGNALAHGRHYVDAVKAYDRVLKIDPKHKGAIKNRKFIQKIIDDINRMSKNQRAEQGEQSDKLEKDEPKTADGADREDFGKQEIEQYKAEEILNNPEINEIWMRQIQQNPAKFLRVKFQMQLKQQEKSSEKK